MMKYLMLRSNCLNRALFSACLLINSSAAYSCDKAQLVDYDYQIKALLGQGYSSSDRVWLLDEKPTCVNSLKYGLCLTVKPVDNGAELTVHIAKDKQNSASYTQQIQYNSSESLRFNAMDVDINLNVFVSNTIADIKMSGKPCDSGFPVMPRQFTRQEIDKR